MIIHYQIKLFASFHYTFTIFCCTIQLMKRIILFIGIFLFVYLASVVAINIPQKKTEVTNTVTVPTNTASPSGIIEIPSIIPNL